MSHTMTRARQVLIVLAAAILALTLAVPAKAFATGTGSITIAPPDGTDTNTTNTYTVYKVFDADGNGTNISYKLVAGKTTAPAGFTVDTAGNVTYTGTGTGGALTAEDIAAIAGYVTESDKIATVETTGTANAVAENLSNGYYYITTTTGTVVTINSTNPNVTVNDKNTVPTVDKKITGVSDGSFDEDGKKALAQLGTTVTFTATVTAGVGSQNYVFHDTMGSGLSFNGNASVQVTGVSDFTVKSTPDTGDTFTVVLPVMDENQTATITYTATVTSDALTVDTGKNTAKVTYGDSNKTNTSPSSETNVYNAKFTVTKHDGSGNGLANAGFVIKKGDKYYKKNGNSVSWVDSIGSATEYTSDENGAVPAFTGLANGTYTLVEKTVPSGFNKAADSTFTINEHNYESSNLEQSATVVNNAGIALPSTGGMGTTILYVVGGIMVLLAGVFLVSRRRASKVNVEESDDLM